MKTIDDINLHTWFIDRELDFVPEHFITSKVLLTDESKLWILEKCVGRFSTISDGLGYRAQPAFEDSKEALFYELIWG